MASILSADPILNIDQPLRTIKVTDAQMKDAITSAASAQNWVVISEGEGRLSATYHKRDYMAKINIRYATTFYTIDYADSVRMRYRGNTIHPTYNKLIQALQTNIVRNLKTVSANSNKNVTTVTQAAPIEDVRSKLAKIKTLHEDGLITTDEYNAKRKALIDSY